MDKYRFREVREEYNDMIANTGNKITQEYMANYCGADNSTISRIERGQTEPTPNILIGYANTFNVSLDYLLRRSDAKNIKNCTVNKELGLSDSAIEILKKIKNSPDYSYLLDIINAIIGDGKHTVDFLVGLFNCMVDEQISLNIKSGAQKTIEDKIKSKKINHVMNYITNIVQPQLKNVIENSNSYKKAEIQEEIDTMFIKQQTTNSFKKFNIDGENKKITIPKYLLDN